MVVVADPEVVAFVQERGGRLYVYAGKAGLKHFRNGPPDDSSIRFKETRADGFLMYLQEGIEYPAGARLQLCSLPHDHLVLRSSTYRADRDGGLYFRGLGTLTLLAVAAPTLIFVTLLIVLLARYG